MDDLGSPDRPVPIGEGGEIPRTGLVSSAEVQNFEPAVCPPEAESVAQDPPTFEIGYPFGSIDLRHNNYNQPPIMLDLHFNPKTFGFQACVGGYWFENDSIGSLRVEIRRAIRSGIIQV